MCELNIDHRFAEDMLWPPKESLWITEVGVGVKVGMRSVGRSATGQLPGYLLLQDVYYDICQLWSVAPCYKIKITVVI